MQNIIFYYRKKTLKVNHNKNNNDSIPPTQSNSFLKLKLFNVVHNINFGLGALAEFYIYNIIYIIIFFELFLYF